MTTANKALNQPAYNSSNWDVPLNANFGVIDTALGTTSTISNTSTYTLSASEYQCMRLRFNGSLPADLTISIPSGVGGFWIVTNATTDSSSAVPCYLTINTTAGGSLGVVIPRAIAPNYRETYTIFSDGTNVNFAFPFVQAGSILQYAGTSAPFGYIICDGSAISRSTYSALFSSIGTTWGSGNGTTTFNVPDLRGAFLRGSGTSSLDPDSPRAVGSFQTEDYLSHTHTDLGHSHGYVRPNNIYAPTGAGSQVAQAVGGDVSRGYADIQASGGAETRPDNFAALVCIKT